MRVWYNLNKIIYGTYGDIMNAKKQLRLIDISIWVIVLLAALNVYVFVFFGRFIFTEEGALKIVSICLIVFFVLLDGEFIRRFIFANAVVLTTEGVRQGKKFIPIEKLGCKEYTAPRTKEKRILFYDKSVKTQDFSDELPKGAISVQNVKGYIGKIKSFYNIKF